MGYTTTIRSKRQRIVTALDIGTSKICCLIAKTSPAPDWFEGKGDALQFEVLGFDHTRAEGLKAGMIAHLDSAEACIRSAVDAAGFAAGEDDPATVGFDERSTADTSCTQPGGAVSQRAAQLEVSCSRRHISHIGVRLWAPARVPLSTASPLQASWWAPRSVWPGRS